MRRCPRASTWPQIAGGHHGVGRESVHLWLVEEQEERPVTPDPVVRVVSVQARLFHPLFVQLVHTQGGALAQLVEWSELDRFGRAGLRAGRFLSRAQAVVAHRALERPAVVLTLLDHPVRAGGHAVAAAVADVLLDDDCAEFRAEQ